MQDAYRQMAAVGYRPAAPSDGHGKIVEPDRQDLRHEAQLYWLRLLREADSGSYFVGAPTLGRTTSFVYTLEALRLHCVDLRVAHDLVPTLLRLAADEYERNAHEE